MYTSNFCIEYTRRKDLGRRHRTSKIKEKQKWCNQTLYPIYKSNIDENITYKFNGQLYGRKKSHFNNGINNNINKSLRCRIKSDINNCKNIQNFVLPQCTQKTQKTWWDSNTMKGKIY
jgi:hypothetical protein